MNTKDSNGSFLQFFSDGHKIVRRNVNVVLNCTRNEHSTPPVVLRGHAAQVIPLDMDEVDNKRGCQRGYLSTVAAGEIVRWRQIG